MLYHILKLFKSLLFCEFLDSKEGTYDDMSNVGILATGTKTGGGSGVRVIIEKILSGEFAQVNKLVVVTNYPNGGVVKIVEEYKERLMNIAVNIELEVVEDFPKRGEDEKFTPENEEIIKGIYNDIIKKNGLDYLLCSGWMKHVLGINPSISQNIHPGPTKEPYGGLHMHGDNVHKLVWKDYQNGIINKSCVTMHFVIPELDRGPIAVQIPVDISECKSHDDVGKTVNATEHKYQWIIYKLIIEGKISWSGIKGDPVKIDMDEIKKYDFPEGTGFGEEIELN